MIRTSTRPTAALLAAAVALATMALAMVAVWGVPTAGAAEREVVVAPNGDLSYAPASLQVEVGDQVTFTWDDDGHSVSEIVPADADNPIESHPDCDAFLGVPDNDCGDEGDAYRWTALEPGEYDFRCRVHPATMTGTVVVGSAASESPSPSPSGSPTPTRSPSPEPSESDTASPTPDPSGSETASEEPSGPASEDPSATPTGEPSPTEPAPTGPSTPAPSPEPVPEAPSVPPVPEALPSVPVPDPSFEAFPEAVDPTVTPSDDVAGDVAIGGDDGDDDGRMLWALVGGAGVLGTIGAIGRTVLGDTWQA